MAKPDDDIPDFEHLKALDDESAPVEPVAEETAAEPAAEPEVVEIVEAQPAFAAPAEELKEIEPLAAPPAGKEEEEEEPEEKEPSKLPTLLPAAAAIGLPVIAIVLAVLAISLYSVDTVAAISTAVYVIVLGYIPLALWLGRKTNTVFVVMLGCILAAVFTGCYCLWMYMGRYKFDVKAQAAKQRVTLIEPRGQQDRYPPAVLG